MEDRNELIAGCISKHEIEYSGSPRAYISSYQFIYYAENFVTVLQA